MITSIFKLTIILCVLLTLSAIWIDRYLRTDRFKTWRQEVDNLWAGFKNRPESIFLGDINTLFCNLFDKIYGQRTFSKRRFGTSVVSTTFAMFIFTAVVGADMWINMLDFDSIHLMIAMFVAPVFINFIPDFFSLAETRWILQLARRKKPIAIKSFLILDIVCTTIIFFIGYCVYMFLALLYLLYFQPSGVILPPGESIVSFIISVIYKDVVRNVVFLQPAGPLILFLTTFVTSLLWIFFVLAYWFIRLSYRTSGVAEFLYERVRHSEQPATITAGFLSILILLLGGGAATVLAVVG